MDILPFAIAFILGMLVATIFEGVNWRKLYEALFGELPDDEP